MKNTEIAFILDRSGSMSSMVTAAVNGFNAFLEEQQNLRDDQQNLVPASFSLILFDNDYEVIHNRCPIADAKPLTTKTYQPRGGTALLDAIGRTVDELGQKLADTPEDQRPVKVIIAILTDGEENSSTKFTVADINSRITHQTQKYAWEFLFLAANQDAIATAGKMGIAARNSVTFEANSDDLGSVQRAMSMKMSTSRKLASAISLTDEERATAEETTTETYERARKGKV